MNLIVLIIISAIILITAYYTYGKYVSKKLGVDNSNITPSNTLEDGIDYVPTKSPIVLGHHFASIAGAGPIIGPVIAVAFGWIPAVIWIIIGGVFFGAVHDMASMLASLRHKGKSIGYVIEKQIGAKGKVLFLIFSFSTLILIVGVFADIIAKTFINNPSVASSSILFIILAVVFGVVNKALKNSKYAFVITSIIGVVLMYFFVYLGKFIPINIGYNLWVIILLGYAFIASVTPVTLLLQPRDYLTSYLLYGLIIAAVIGIFIANPEVKMDNDIVFKSPDLGYIFPVLFVTVACGAISGFHSLVASGTTSKQLNKESDAKIVGYGGMLIETFLAILSVIAVMVISREEYVSQLLNHGPVSLFADGLGKIIAAIGISKQMATSFVALTVSAFALTTLDTCTRLARFTFQEYFDDKEHSTIKKVGANRYIATTVVILSSIVLLSTGEFDVLWPIFGSANQLLAALALLAIAVWLIKKRINASFVLIPMYVMFAVALSSLCLFAITNYQNGTYILAILAGALFLLAIVLLWLAKNSLKREQLHQDFNIPGKNEDLGMIKSKNKNL
ncbi:carbon starvation CstA family protein [Zunongwangia atlantica]|uniref:Carbon starvation protein csta n=1 Tax=Zunongwangia atlantica 22II14-10F7 TaxID=1185767 RepID=A0A1Y1T544_9FLAO|nr:carbon starvation protein A [Zunongwangia atlantica]ORL46158.1 carbon starvation protein csta [Zunongwangia atlantica 22II14-10F7]